MKLISFPSWFTGTSSVQWEYLYAYCPVVTVATGHFRKQASIALQAGTPLDLGYAYFHLIIRLTTWALYLHILCTHTPLNNAPGNVSNLSPSPPASRYITCLHKQWTKFLLPSMDIKHKQVLFKCIFNASCKRVRGPVSPELVCVNEHRTNCVLCMNC